ncbi:MAG: penicillin-binding transpeptidase domain-containing protein [Desulfobulbales bacterium]|nr:penicillin-binding transpeptidase domain-containing protein [Desulfobulbales bacterium]
MRRSSRKRTKKKLPKLVAALLLLVCTAVLVPLTRAWFSGDQPVGPSKARGGRDPESALDISRRSTIYDRGYRELAVSFMMKSLYARPLEIEDVEETAAFVAERLGLDPAALGRKLKSERSFVWLGRQLPGEKAEAVLQKNLAGIYAIDEPRRIYPVRRSGAHVVGFMEENNGLAGVELNFDHILRRGSGGDGEAPLMTGHLQLTLDLRIQELLADRLGELLDQTGAATGTAIVLNYTTGAVLAMVGFPDYDPNSYWDADRNGLLNRAVNGGIELGGFSALFGLAAAHETAGEASRDRLASLKMDLRLDSRANGMRPGGWFVKEGDDLLSPELRGWRENAAGERERAALAARLGLFGKSGIDLPEMGDPAGSGRATPLKLLAAFAVLVNGGREITPHVGEALIDPGSGRRAMLDRPDPKSELIGVETSRKMVELLSGASRAGAETIILESIRPIEAGSEEKEVEGVVGEKSEPRYQTVLLGFTPDRGKGLALLVALDRALIDSDKKTSMRSMAEEVVGPMADLAAAPVEPPGPEAMAAGEKRIFEAWLGSRAYDQLVAAAADDATGEVKRPDVMPDLQGLSLRKGLRVLQPFGVRVKVVGSGRIVDQEPAAGVIFDAGECRLSLRTDG